MTSLKRNGRSHQGKPFRTRSLIYNPAMRRSFLLALLLSTPLFAQNQDFSKVEVKAQKVAGSVWANGEEIKAVHFPHGHTDGDAVIFFSKSNVVHMGDDFFNGMYPFVDVENGGSVKGMIAGVQSVLGTMPDDAKVIPGHGALFDKAGL